MQEGVWRVTRESAVQPREKVDERDAEELEN